MAIKVLPSLLLAFSYYSFPALATDTIHPHVDVAIIGAGFSGLTAAKELQAANKSFVVLEAYNRVGGRVFDDNFPDGTRTYRGAQFVGAAQTNMVAMAKEMGVELIPTFNSGNTVLVINGTRTVFSPDASGAENLPVDPAILVEVANTEKILNEFANEINPAAPWNHSRANEWDSQTIASWLDSQSLSPIARLVFDTTVSTGFCEESGEVSFLSLLLSIGTSRNETETGSLDEINSAVDGAESMICKGGCQNIAINIAKILGPDNVKLNAPVRVVRKTDHGYKITTDAGTVTSKRVVVAMPPVMSSRIRWVPPMPAGRDQVSQRMPMGSIAKVIAKYKAPFWREDGLSGQALSNTGLVVSAYDISPEDGCSGVLLGFVPADRARAIDGKSHEYIQDLVKKDFVNLFGPKASAPTDWVIQQWDQEEYTRGGYNSNFPPGTLTKYGPYIATPFQGIHFAGVETSLFWRGYMDGAISAGKRAAIEVLDSLNN
ncbi:amine oxidase [Stemphylium lycopersici]|uniref:Amine oxidase n=1 Tax=Stemphylium lycopersici TaxID=183478 RepID=A0A364MRB0_STELY|nr:amine oxidase [Stemphylium lycopersici]